jgi:hypothetical protein
LLAAVLPVVMLAVVAAVVAVVVVVAVALQSIFILPLHFPAHNHIPLARRHLAHLLALHQ